MKQFLIVMPENKAWAFSEWSFANEIRVVISYLKGADFFGSDKLHCICQANDAGIEALNKSDFKQFVTAKP